MKLFGVYVELSKYVDVGIQSSPCERRHIQIRNRSKARAKVPYGSALELEIAV